MNIRAIGPWVWLKVLPTERKRGLLYLPDGNMEQRLGHSVAEVISVGSGKTDKKGRRISPEVKPGDVVLFRGYLKIVHQPDFDQLDHCLVHVDDIAGVLEG